MLQCPCGATARLADQNNRLSLRETGRIERRQRLIQSAVAALEFMRLSHIHDNAILVTQRLHQLIVFDGWDARRTRQFLQ